MQAKGRTKTGTSARARRTGGGGFGLSRTYGSECLCGATLFRAIGIGSKVWLGVGRWTGALTFGLGCTEFGFGTESIPLGPQTTAHADARGCNDAERLGPMTRS